MKKTGMFGRLRLERKLGMIPDPEAPLKHRLPRRSMPGAGSGATGATQSSPRAERMRSIRKRPEHIAEGIRHPAAEIERGGHRLVVNGAGCLAVPDLFGFRLAPDGSVWTRWIARSKKGRLKGTRLDDNWRKMEVYRATDGSTLIDIVVKKSTTTYELSALREWFRLGIRATPRPPDPPPVAVVKVVPPRPARVPSRPAAGRLISGFPKPRMDSARPRSSLRAGLRSLGMNYREYLASDLWRAARERYRGAGRLMACIGCNDPRYQLHHLTYVRLGAERPSDLVPLCADCHRNVHEFHRVFSTDFLHVHVALAHIFGMPKKVVAMRIKRGLPVTIGKRGLP